jgi:hypothetical protein
MLYLWTDDGILRLKYVSVKWSTDVLDWSMSFFFFSIFKHDGMNSTKWNIELLLTVVIVFKIPTPDDNET